MKEKSLEAIGVQIQQEVIRQQINKIMGTRPYANMGMASILRK